MKHSPRAGGREGGRKGGRERASEKAGEPARLSLATSPSLGLASRFPDFPHPQFHVIFKSLLLIHFSQREIHTQTFTHAHAT